MAMAAPQCPRAGGLEWRPTLPQARFVPVGANSGRLCKGAQCVEMKMPDVI